MIVVGTSIACRGYI